VKTRTVAFLVGALALLALIVVVAERSAEQSRDTKLGGGELLRGYTTDAVVRFEIRARDQSWTLTKNDDAWTVGDEGFEADAAEVRRALDKLTGLDRRELVAQNPQKHEDLEVGAGSPRGVEVQLWTGASAEPTHHLHLGKTASDFRSSFVRLDSEDQVYLSRELLRSVFDKGERGWRDRTVFSFRGADATGLEITKEGVTVVVERGEDGWRLTSPEESAADGPAIDSIVSTLSALSTDEFAAASDDSTTGLHEPSGSAIVSLSDGTRRGLVFGLEDDGKVFARTIDGSDVYRFFSYRRNAIVKGLDELRAKALDDASDLAPQTAPADMP